MLYLLLTRANLRHYHDVKGIFFGARHPLSHVFLPNSIYACINEWMSDTAVTFHPNDRYFLFYLQVLIFVDRLIFAVCLWLYYYCTYCYTVWQIYVRWKYMCMSIFRPNITLYTYWWHNITLQSNNLASPPMQNSTYSPLDNLNISASFQNLIKNVFPPLTHMIKVPVVVTTVF